MMNEAIITYLERDTKICRVYFASWDK